MPLSTPDGPKGLFPDATFLAKDVVPKALIHQVTTVAGSIAGDEPVIRVPYVVDDLDIGFVPEGQPIPEVSTDLDEVLVKTAKLATLQRQSNESRNSTANKLLADSMANSITVKANTALLGNAVNAAQPTGLHNVAGIGAVAAAVTNSLDPVAEALTLVEVAGGTPTAIILDPASWGVLRLMKREAGSNEPLLGAPAEQADRQLFGVPVIVAKEAPAGTGLVVDKTNIVSAVGKIGLDGSADWLFNLDSYGHRATWRIGWQVIRPTRLAKFAVTVAAPPARSGA